MTAPARGWGGGGSATTLFWLRHGVTAHTVDKRFSGGLGGANPPLSDEGRVQAAVTARWLAPALTDLTDLVTSPVLRARETAGIAGELWGRGEPGVEAAVAEMDFGSWEGLTFAEVREQHGDLLDAWLGSVDTPAGGTGESFRAVEARVLEGIGRIVADHRGGTVVVVSHVTPIKIAVAHALGAPLEAVFRMELAPASVSVVTAYADPDTEASGAPGRLSLRLFNGRPPEAGPPFA